MPDQRSTKHNQHNQHDTEYQIMTYPDRKRGAYTTCTCNRIDRTGT